MRKNLQIVLAALAAPLAKANVAMAGFSSDPQSSPPAPQSHPRPDHTHYDNSCAGGGFDGGGSFAGTKYRAVDDLSGF